MKTLKELAPSERGEVHSVTGTGSISRRLAELGFIKGQPVKKIIDPKTGQEKWVPIDSES